MPQVLILEVNQVDSSKARVIWDIKIMQNVPLRQPQNQGTNYYCSFQLQNDSLNAFVTVPDKSFITIMIVYEVVIFYELSDTFKTGTCTEHSLNLTFQRDDSLLLNTGYHQPLHKTQTTVQSMVYPHHIDGSFCTVSCINVLRLPK